MSEWAAMRYYLRLLSYPNLESTRTRSQWQTKARHL